MENPPHLLMIDIDDCISFCDVPNDLGVFTWPSEVPMVPLMVLRSISIQTTHWISCTNLKEKTTFRV